MFVVSSTVEIEARGVETPVNRRRKFIRAFFNATS